MSILSRQAQSLEALPAEMTIHVCTQLVNDQASLKSLRLTSKTLNSFTSTVLFRDILLYQYPSSWAKANQIANHTSLAPLVRQIQITLISSLPLARTYLEWFHFAQKYLSIISAQGYKPKATDNICRRHYEKYLNWLSGEADMISYLPKTKRRLHARLDDLRDYVCLRPVKIQRFTRLSNIVTARSEDLKHSDRDKSSVEYFHKRERETWIVDKLFNDLPSDTPTILGTRQSASRFLWLRNCHLTTLVLSAQTAEERLGALQLTSFGDILITDRQSRRLHPRFELVNLRHLALHFKDREWDQLGFHTSVDPELVKSLLDT